MKLILLLSGGMDSLAATILMHNQGHEIHSLFIRTGLPSDDKVSAVVKKISEMYCASHKELSLAGLNSQGMDNIGVGLRPIAFPAHVWHTLAISYGAEIGVNFIVSGNKGEYSSEDFEEKFIAFSGTSKLQPSKMVLKPLKGITDFNQIYMIIKDSPLLKETISCLYENPCGECSKCRLRLQFNIDTPK
jgi:7-cyano-7-deazaguanine synthase in queuosine biosynthesis